MGKTATNLNNRLVNIYNLLFSHFGPQHWWPGDTPFEVAVGAILTQNTNWGNVERAIANLKNADALSARALHDLPRRELAVLIRPAGYYNVKAERLEHFLSFLLNHYGGSMKRMQKKNPAELRKALLDVHGIGPETADSILLYALDKPVFVIDAYTKRVLQRHGFVTDRTTYHEMQDLFHRSLPNEVRLFNEYHALLVMLGKHYCRPRPRCEGCPLEALRG